MKKKQMLAMLLAALMTLSVPLVAFAEGEPTDIQERSIALYGTPDYEAPILHSISVDKETVQQGETLTFTLNVTDDVSGLDYISLALVNETSESTLGNLYEFVEPSETNTYTTQVQIPKNEAAGNLRLDYVEMTDKAGHSIIYWSSEREYPYDNRLPNEITIQVGKEHDEDLLAPELHRIEIETKTVKAGEFLTFNLDVSDDVSGIDYASAYFVNKENGRTIPIDHSEKVPVKDGKIQIKKKIDEYEGNGTFQLDHVQLNDSTGHTSIYRSRDKEFPSEPYLPQEVSFTVINESVEDYTAPQLHSVSIKDESVEAPGSTILTLKVSDDVSGVYHADAYFVNERTGETILADKYFDVCKEGELELPIIVSEFKQSGLFELDHVTLRDKAGNSIYYHSASENSETPLPNEITLFVKNIDKDDTTGDVITSTNNSNLVEQIENMAEGSTAHIYYGNGATLSKDVFEAIKGQDKTIALKSDGIEWIFNGKDVTDENIKDIDLSTSIKVKWNSNSNAVEGIDWQQNALILSFAENGKLPAPAKIRIKADWVFKNEVGTENLYVYYYDNTSKEYVQVAADLTITQDEYLEFVVDHNSDFVITHGELKKKEEPSYPDPDVPQPNPQPNPEQKPFQPSYSTGSSASGSSVTSVKSAPESSGSSIKQEEKDRLFWKNKQDQIRKAANGKKIRIFIPKETTRVPASFMESIRTAENDITVELRWNGKKITITPETALKRSPRRVFWNLKTLLEYYHA